MEAEEVKTCKNPGCKKQYKESENSEEACFYHSGAPIFHDLKKGWACCGVTVDDWEDFQQIKGCTKGKHDCCKDKVEFWKSQTTEYAQKSLEREQYFQSLKTPEDAEREFALRKKQQEQNMQEEIVMTSDGKYRCGNNGCSKPYNPAENTETSCKYHKGAPMFHDVKKFWTCCNQETVIFKIQWDWDEFQKIPTCCVGAHVPKLKKVMKK